MTIWILAVIVVAVALALSIERVMRALGVRRVEHPPDREQVPEGWRGVLASVAGSAERRAGRARRDRTNRRQGSDL